MSGGSFGEMGNLLAAAQKMRKAMDEAKEEIAGQEVLLTGYEDWRGVTLRAGTARLDDNGAYATDERVYVRDTEGRRWCSGT